MHYGRTQHWAEGDANRKWVYVRAGSHRHRRQPLPSTSPQGTICAASCRSWSRRCGTRPAKRRPTWMLIKADVPRSPGWPRKRRRSPPIHPARYAVVEATKAFNELEDGILVRDGGATVIFQWTHSQSKPRDVIWNQNFGHLAPACRTRSAPLGGRGRQAPGHAADLGSGVPVPHRRSWKRCATETSAGLRGGRRSPVGSGGRRVQAGPFE